MRKFLPVLLLIMSKDKLIDYVLHLKKWFPEKICKKTVEELASQKWKKHTYQDESMGTSASKNNAKELDVTEKNYSLTYDDELHDLMWKSLERYILQEHSYARPYHRGWTGFSQIRFNRYQSDQIMSKHCDHIYDLFSGTPRGIPILSMVGLLNDDYEGGEFIMFDDYHIKLNTGDCLIFPSIFLYPHEVKPITKGIRYSFISWSY